eukprot:3932606-Rhodomonas_salina.1
MSIVVCSVKLSASAAELSAQRHRGAGSVDHLVCERWRQSAAKPKVAQSRPSTLYAHKHSVARLRCKPRAQPVYSVMEVLCTHATSAPRRSTTTRPLKICAVEWKWRLKPPHYRHVTLAAQLLRPRGKPVPGYPGTQHPAAAAAAGVAVVAAGEGGREGERKRGIHQKEKEEERKRERKREVGRKREREKQIEEGAREEGERESGGVPDSVDAALSLVGAVCVLHVLEPPCSLHPCPPAPHSPSFNTRPNARELP